jgi:TRAP-type C4-dicarboxylate transport system substrate-binding protein
MGTIFRAGTDNRFRAVTDGRQAGGRQPVDMSRNSATIRLTAAVVAVAALGGLTSCSGEPITKAGTAGQGEHTIVLQMPDGSDPDGLYLAQDVAKLSHGALKVTIDSKTYNSQSPANEARLTADIRAGRVGFAYQPARDWAAVGVPGFQALMAPFAVTTVAGSQRVAASPVAATVLGQLSGYGVVGLGLIAGEPRQILSVKPLFTHAQFAGQRIRIVDNPQTAALVTALGAHPVQRLTSNVVGAKMRAGSVAGVETSPFTIAENAYQTAAPYLTAYGIFPKFQTLVASKQAWSALPLADQALIRHAAVDTRAHSGNLSFREALELTKLCQQGVVLDQPTAAQLGALAQDAAAAAPAGAAAAAVDRQVRALPGTGVQPYATGVPAGCRVASDAASAAAIHQVLTPALAHRGGGKIPAGTYVTTDTVADWQAGGQYGKDWSTAVTFTTVIRADGTLRETQVPDYPDQGPVSGHYVVKGDEVTFFVSAGPSWSATETVRWSYFGGQLTFAIVDVNDTSSRVIYTAHPWRKIK